jgi:hypothetical protein
MASKQLSREKLTRIRQGIQQRRKEKKATASGSTDISQSGEYVDVSYWDAFFSYDGSLLITATVKANSGNLASCEISCTLIDGTQVAQGAVYGNSSNLGSSIDINALTGLVGNKPSGVNSEISGVTDQGNTFNHSAYLYVYDQPALAKVAVAGR